MPRLSLKARISLQGRLKLAQLMEMSEEDLGRMAVRLENAPLFQRLAASGALRVTPFSKAFFATRRYAGFNMRTGAAGLAGLLDGNSGLVGLIRKVGRKNFEEVFLQGGAISDAERGRRCGISAAEAGTLRDFLDRMYVHAEFEEAPAAAPPKVYSTVAGIVIQEGTPALRFFNREIWKGRYRFDEDRLAAYRAGLKSEEAESLRSFLARLEFVDRRKTSLLKILEALLELQRAYLVSGDPLRLQPLTQRSLAVGVDVEQSALNRLISNKAVELPWGTEVPLRALFPSAKALAIRVVGSLAKERPELSDEGLRTVLAAEHEIHLSRRSIAQYRKDTGVGGRRRR